MKNNNVKLIGFRTKYWLTTARKKMKRQKNGKNPKPLRTFMDMQNVAIPKLMTVPIFHNHFVKKLRSLGFSAKHLHFYHTSFSKRFLPEFLPSHVTTHVVSPSTEALPRDICDVRLLIDLLIYCLGKKPPAPALIISNDKDFLHVAKRLRTLKYEVFVSAFNRDISPDLKKEKCYLDLGDLRIDPGPSRSIPSYYTPSPRVQLQRLPTFSRRPKTLVVWDIHTSPYPLFENEFPDRSVLQKITGVLDELGVDPHSIRAYYPTPNIQQVNAGVTSLHLSQEKMDFISRENNPLFSFFNVKYPHDKVKDKRPRDEDEDYVDFKISKHIAEWGMSKGNSFPILLITSDNRLGRMVNAMLGLNHQVYVATDLKNPVLATVFANATKLLSSN